MNERPRYGKGHTYLPLGVKLDVALREGESLGDKRAQFADTTTLLTKDGLGTGGSDDDLSALRGDTHLNTRVTILSELTGEELVQLGVEDSVSDELSLLRNTASSAHD